MLHYKRFPFALFFLLIIVCGVAKPALSGDDLFERRDQLILDWVMTSERPADETVPPEIFRMLKKDKKNEKAWQALHRYRSFTDAGGSLMFYRDCFGALEDDPLIFFDRYIAGDEQAIFLMVDALTHDYSAFERETFEHTDQVYRRSLQRGFEAMLGYNDDREKYRRALDFHRISESQYCFWRLRYKKNQPCEFWK